MSTETSNLGKVETELVLQPVDGVTGATSENVDEIISRKLSGLCITVMSVTEGILDRLEHTDFLVSSKKILALSGMPASCWV